LAKWLGSKGWNSDRKPSGKLEPHLPPVLLDRWFEVNDEPPKPMSSLAAWLDDILKEASPTPV